MPARMKPEWPAGVRSSPCTHSGTDASRRAPPSGRSDPRTRPIAGDGRRQHVTSPTTQTGEGRHTAQQHRAATAARCTPSARLNTPGADHAKLQRFYVTRGCRCDVDIVPHAFLGLLARRRRRVAGGARPEGGASIGESIVVGTDGSDRARKAVDEAVRLSKVLGAELDVVSAFQPMRDARIVGGPEGAAKVWAPHMVARMTARTLTTTLEVPHAGGL
jgi:Universal stress protein family